MGREKVLERIRKDGKKMIIGGVILFILGLFVEFVFFVAYQGLDPMMVLIMLWLIPGLLLIIFGVRKRRDPMNAGCFKKNQQLLRQADELFRDILYQDKFIIFSNRVIANNKDITQMVYVDDVLWIYEWKTSTNMITAQHCIRIRTLSQTMDISVYGRSKATRDDLLTRVHKLCPNSRVGDTKENQAYYNQIEQSRKVYMQ